MTSNRCISPLVFLLLPLLITFLQLLRNGNRWGYLANINIVHCDKWEIRLLYMCIYVGKKVLDGVVLVSTRHVKWWVEPFWHWQYIIGWSSYIMIMTCKTVSPKISHQSPLKQISCQRARPYTYEAIVSYVKRDRRCWCQSLRIE